MMRRTIATTAVSATRTAGATWSRSLASTSTVLQAARKPRVGDIDTSKVDFTAGIDVNSPTDEDPLSDVQMEQLVRQKFRDRKGYPHPFDELDPTDEPFKPKKAQFPF